MPTSSVQATFVGSRLWRRVLVDNIRKAAPESTILFLNKNNIYPADGSTTADQRLLTNTPIHDLVRAASVRPAHGLFSVVSQISPNGSGNFEDLTILDPTNSDEWLVVIIRNTEDNHTVFRRLFRGDQ